MYIYKRFSLNFIRLVVCSAIIISLTGCFRKTAPIVERIPDPETRILQFSNTIIVHSGYEVVDDSDPEQLIKKGIALSEDGRHIFAAEYFMNVASHIITPDNKLTVSSLFGAANEYLMMGDLENFTKVMRSIEKILTRFDRTHLGSQESSLLAIYDVTQGKTYVSGVHPTATREIFIESGN